MQCTLIFSSLCIDIAYLKIILAASLSNDSHNRQAKKHTLASVVSSSFMLPLPAYAASSLWIALKLCYGLGDHFHQFEIQLYLLYKAILRGEEDDVRGIPARQTKEVQREERPERRGGLK